jgi:hypothetical protein
MYGWVDPNLDDLVSIDKSTGVATLVGDSGHGTGTYALSFNSLDELYLFDWGRDVYLVDTGTGELSWLGDLDGAENEIHHGSFDWLTDLHYSVSYFGTRVIYRCDLLTLSCTELGAPGNLHVVAFQNVLGTTKYELSVDKAGTGTGTIRSSPAGINCGSDCSHDYFSGRTVTLYAFADADSTFAGWSGDEDCSDGMVTMDAARSCTATFNLKSTYALSVEKSGTGTGTVTSSPAGIDCGTDCSESYMDGTQVTLTPSANSDSLFVGWSGDTDCSDGTVTMDAARSCTATFDLKPYYTLSVTKIGSGTGNVYSNLGAISCGSVCSDSYMAGTVVTLTHAADADSFFVAWSGAADCFDGTVAMTNPVSCTATFNGRIAVTSPNGGQTWQVGTEQAITWTYEGNEGTYVTIELLKGGVLEKKLSKRVSIGTGGNGSMTWKPVGKLDGSDYSIRITSNSNPLFTDTSDGYFTIVPRH